MSSAAPAASAAVLECSPDGPGPRSLFSSQAWVDVITSTYGFVPQAAHAGDSALLFSIVDDIRQRRLVSFPFSDYCDPLLASVDDWPGLLDQVVAAAVPASLRLLHTRMPRDDRFDCRPVGLWHATHLSRPPAEIWSGFPSAARQNVRRAERDGITIRLGNTLADVELFHRMHRALRRRRYELLAQPRRFFEALHATFIGPDAGFVLIAEQRGEPIAGLFLIQSGSTLYYKFNASTDRGSRPNDLLAWRAIQEGHSRGLDWLDFGFSDLDQPGLHRFKRKFADQEETIVGIRHTPPRWNGSSGQEASRVLGRLTALFVDPLVPESLSARAGDLAYRYFC